MRWSDGFPGGQRDASVIAEAAGIVLGVAIGAGCRWFDLPLPAPPRLVGALLVVAMTLGFVGTDWVIGGLVR
jgi:XapX domain-containing protein